MRSILLKCSVPSVVLGSEIFIAILSIRWSMLCIWYLFLCIASLSIFESNAILMDWSDLTVITTGLMKYSSENDVSFLTCLSSVNFSSSFSTFSTRCSGIRLPLCCVGLISLLNVDFATWFCDLPSLVHKCGYFWNIHLDILKWVFVMLSKFLPPFCCVPIVRRRPSLSMMSLPIIFIVLVSTNRIVQFFAVDVRDVMSTWIVPSMLILLLLKHLNSPRDLSACWIFVLLSASRFLPSGCSWNSWGFLYQLTNRFVFCWCLFSAKIPLF